MDGYSLDISSSSLRPLSSLQFAEWAKLQTQGRISMVARLPVTVRCLRRTLAEVVKRSSCSTVAETLLQRLGAMDLQSLRRMVCSVLPPVS